MVGPFSLARRSIGALVLLCISTFSGCAAPVNESASAQNVPEDRVLSPAGHEDLAQGLRLALLRPSTSTDMAAIEGILRVDGLCLYVAGPKDFSGKTTPAFSFAEVSWDAGTKILTARGLRIGEGQKVRLTGSTSSKPETLSWHQKPDPSCNLSHVFVTGAIEPLPDKRVR